MSVAGPLKASDISDLRTALDFLAQHPGQLVSPGGSRSLSGDRRCLPAGGRGHSGGSSHQDRTGHCSSREREGLMTCRWWPASLPAEAYCAAPGKHA